MFAQEMQGVVNSNYSGIIGASSNPANLSDSKLYFDLNFLTLDVFAYNNYVYFPNQTKILFEAFRSHDKYSGESAYFQNDDNKNAFINVRLLGPSAMVNWGRHGFGFQTSVRSAVSVRNFPYQLADALHDDTAKLTENKIKYFVSKFGEVYRDKNRIVTIKSIRANSLTWAEINFSYAYTFYKRNRSQWAAGITIKRLLGYEAAYIYTKPVDFVVSPDSSLTVQDVQAEYGFSLPVNYYTDKFYDGKPFFKGLGWGFDFGITYQKKVKVVSQYEPFDMLCEQRFNDYKYKIGVTLLDIGSIKFDNHAGAYAINNATATWANVLNLKIDNLYQLNKDLSYMFYNDPNATFKSDEFTMYLPSALSLQFDYHYLEPWYVNTTLIYGIPLSNTAIRRPTELYVTPRYETRKFEVSLPMSLYEMRYPRVGFAVRYQNFTIGSDELIGYYDLTLDLYFSVKFSLAKGYCKTKKDEANPCRGY